MLYEHIYITNLHNVLILMMRPLFIRNLLLEMIFTFFKNFSFEEKKSNINGTNTKLASKCKVEQSTSEFNKHSRNKR